MLTEADDMKKEFLERNIPMEQIMESSNEQTYPTM